MTSLLCRWLRLSRWIVWLTTCISGVPLRSTVVNTAPSARTLVRSYRCLSLANAMRLPLMASNFSTALVLTSGNRLLILNDSLLVRLVRLTFRVRLHMTLISLVRFFGAVPGSTLEDVRRLVPSVWVGVRLVVAARPVVLLDALRVMLLLVVACLLVALVGLLL